ncbi:sel1 repeat family protein [Vibrio sp. Of7-15]|uniref:tetratricopeptide repeat protein n=1 Tax=Vibrio sp. Of7-15 TaxID=2724879 RepID=UPI001EF187A3|nr:tetratricopeptide repeat protein [Vibrio sp. Of7-15]MCG7497471.1 sel1 repeat family protein [Vibrio sp. Of7-15]
MNVKLLPLLGLLASVSPYGYADTQSPYTEVKENRVSVDLKGVITHGFHPDVEMYYASTVFMDDDGELQVEGANYYGHPEFDWQVNDGFYAFCDGKQIKLGVNTGYVNFRDTYSQFLFTLDNDQRFYYEPTITENEKLYFPELGKDKLFFRPSAAFINALKHTQTVEVEIKATGRLSTTEKNHTGALSVGGVAEMLTRVMNHCPETAPEEDVSQLSPSQRLVTKAKQLMDIKRDEEAFPLLKEASELGDGEASLLLAGYYFEDTENDNRLELARDTRRLGAKQGNTDAMCAAAVDYVQLKHKDDSYGPKGLKLFEEAEAKGASCAYFNLGYMYIMGMVVEKDMQRGREYLKRVAHESPSALNILLQTYYGEPKEMDSEVYPWLKLMIKNHDFDLNMKATICKRSPELCEKEEAS